MAPVKSHRRGRKAKAGRSLLSREYHEERGGLKAVAKGRGEGEQQVFRSLPGNLLPFAQPRILRPAPLLSYYQRHCSRS